MLKKVGVTIHSEQYSVSDELYNAFCQGMDGDDFPEADEEALFAAMETVREGQPNNGFPAEPPEKDENDTLEIFTEGRLKIRDGEVSLTYTETEESGFDHLETVLRFSEATPEVVSMIRFGEVNASFLFEARKRTKCVYNMPFGALELTIRTVSVDNRLVNEGILVLDYYIEIRGANAEHKCVTITLRME